MKTIGSRIRKYRKETLGIKGYQLAKLLKISQGSLSDIENCKSDPSASTLAKLAVETDVDIKWLLVGKSK